MFEVPCPKDRIVVYGAFPAFTAKQLFDYFTAPELLTQWWPQTADIDLKVGGGYCLGWPKSNWYLRGTYTAVESGEHLGFTWAWDHGAPGYDPLQVDIHFQTTEEGTCLAIYHGPFEDTEPDQEARTDIIGGWIHFGNRLRELRS